MTRLLAVIFVVGGTLHFVMPARYISIMPAWLPAHGTIVALSGVAEIAGGIGLLVRRTRRAAGIGLILLLIAVLPANVEMLREARAAGVAPWAETLLWLRLPLQLLLAWWVWRVIFPRSPKYR